MNQLTRMGMRRAACKVSPLKEEYVSKVLKEFFNVLTDSMKNGNRVLIHGAFTLEPVLRKGRPAFNPQTMEPVWVPDHIGVRCGFHTSVRDEKIKAIAEPFYREVEG